jgi:hypothetical protein
MIKKIDLNLNNKNKLLHSNVWYQKWDRDRHWLIQICRYDRYALSFKSYFLTCL